MVNVDALPWPFTFRAGLSESFEIDGWNVKVSGQSRDILLKNVIHKEMPSKVAGQH